MKVLIFECWNKSPQFDTCLEIAENHVATGDEVTFVNVAKSLTFIEWQTQIPPNPLHNIYLHKRLDQKVKKAKSVVSPGISIYTDSLLDKGEINTLYNSLEFKSIDELKQYTWKGIDIGMAVTSSLISITNDLNPDTKVKYKGLINKMIQSSKIMAESFVKWLEKENPDLVYFRNGRVSSYRPIYRICKERNIDFRIHDRGCDKNHYSISKDLRHFFDMINDEVIEVWDKEEDSEYKEKIAAKYYSDRQKGIEQGWVAFCQDQTKLKMPDTWNDDKYNIVYFNSSISEYAAINQDQFKDNIFNDQVESIHYILDTIKDHSDIDIHLRLHPNLLNQDIKEQNLWNELKTLDGLNLIPAESDIDTYALVAKADLIIVHYSTVGAESAYLEKPVIQLSKSEYYKLGSTYFPKTKDEFKSWILSKNLKPLPNLGAKKYGFYLSTFGEEYKYFKAESFAKGTFKGVNLQEKPLLLKKAHELYFKLRK